jgi:hypothetical protein
MSTPKYLKFRVSSSGVDENGKPTNATIHAVGGTLPENAAYQKYLTDILAHHLAGTPLDIENQRFTFTFPFKLS